jgi:type III restriction enzyme
LADDPNAKDFLKSEELGYVVVDNLFDPAYATRAIVDIVPNPWIARAFVGKLLADLKNNGLNAENLAGIGSLLIETLRSQLLKERDRLAEVLFLQDVTAGRIQFRLHTDRHNWRLPHELITQRPVNSPLLQRDDGKIAEHSLFDPVYKDDLDGYEQKVACYLDGENVLPFAGDFLLFHSFGSI